MALDWLRHFNWKGCYDSSCNWFEHLKMPLLVVGSIPPPPI